MDLDFLKTRNFQSTFDGQDVYFGTSEPTSPVDGSLWFTSDISDSFSGQPWRYDGTLGIWLSDPVLLPIPKITLTTSSSFQYFPVKTYATDSDRIYLQDFAALVFNLSSTSHTQTNYWALTIKGHQSSGAIWTFWDSPSNTGYNWGNASGLPGNLPRHINHPINQFIGGRTWSIGCDFVRNGNAPSIEASGTLLFRYVK